MKRRSFEILHEDDDILVLDKAPGVLSIPDRFRTDLFSVYGYLREKRPEIYVVHRLDRDTSGVMLLAKNRQAHRRLSEQFERRQVEKIYWALVHGCPYPTEQTIDLPIGESSRQRGVFRPMKQGKAATTTIRVLEAFRNYSVVVVRLETGRTHQIRVHMQAIGHPLLVDPKYGGSSAFFVSQLKGKAYRRSKGREEKALIARHTLHAKQIRFEHPTLSESKIYEAPLPKDMTAAIQQLRKWDR